MAKLDQYYQCSAKSDAHIMAMGTVSSFPCSMYDTDYNTAAQSSTPRRRWGTLRNTGQQTRLKMSRMSFANT